MAKKSKTSSNEKRKKAYSMAGRAKGVTPAELAAALNVSTPLPMASLLARMEREGTVEHKDNDVRDGGKVFHALAGLDPLDPPKKSSGTKSKAKKAKTAKKDTGKGKAPKKAKTAKKDTGKGKAPKKAKSKPRKAPKASKAAAGEAPVQTALRLASRSGGVTVDEIADERGSKVVAPFSKTVNKGVRDGVLAQTGEERGGKPVYTATGASVPAKVKKKPGRKPAARKAAAKPKKAAPAPAALVAAPAQTADTPANELVARWLELTAQLLRQAGS